MMKLKKIINVCIITIILFLIQSLASKLGGIISEWFDYTKIDKDDIFMRITIHHIIQMLFALIFIFAIGKIKKIDFYLKPKVSRKGIAYTSIFAIIILIYVLVSYIIGYRLNTIQPYEYNLNLKNVIGTLGFQLFLSGTSEEILFRAFIKGKSIIYPVIMHGLSNFFMVGIGYIFAIVLNNI